MSEEKTGAAPAETTEAPAAPADFSALRALLPEELRASPALASYTSFEAMARSHVAAQRMIGKRIEDATPDELGRYYARHGRPDTPDGYEFAAPEEGSTGAPSALECAARGWFHEAGLSQRQAEVLHEKWNAFAKTRLNEDSSSREAERLSAERELRGEWGRTYEKRVAAATKAVAAFGGAPLAQYLDETGLGNDPHLVRAFAKIAETVAEDTLTGNGDGDFMLAPDAAKAEIARAIRDPAYFDPNHPGHRASVERMTALFAAAYPEIPAPEGEQIP